ncbi:MAG TPA: LON peptidase substrate-binding domain-containing protein [Bryobacteraceae bacterium]|nr:LON peptidase substrate-binding domain-containing protein [Bryobacteraceae bacterium]
MSRLLPLFPLQLVAFPGSAIPLHIFEERYRRMVGEAEAAGSEFGIVLAKDEGIVNAGCTVLVEEVIHRYPDGRFDVMTRGRRRFLIRSVDDQLDYLRGEVDFFEDDDFTAVPEPLRARVFEGIRRLGKEQIRFDPDDPQVSFQLIRAIDDLDFQNLMQRSRSELDRFQKIAAVIDKFIERKDYAAKMKIRAAGNGFGHKPANM